MASLNHLFGTACIALTVAVGCGATAPSKELVDARSAYKEASQGKAAELVPDKLLSAKQALDRAEAVHNDDAGSVQEKSQAYVAQRMAELAVALAGQIQAQKDAVDSEKAYHDAQEQALKSVRQQLAAENNKVGEQAKKLAQQEADLASEKAARLNAEKRLADAMKSLEEIAKVKEEQRGMVITLEGAVLFASGKTALLPIAKDKLAKVAEVLQNQSDDKRIVVEGHTDSVGSDDDNLRLSQGRADSVREYLVSQGVKADRISAIGKGESTPIADNKTPEGRANNRRVEIVVK